MSDYQLETLNVIRSPRGFAIVPVHYSHDPEKDDEWVAEAKRRMMTENPSEFQKKWNQEQEIDFTEVSGALAYPNYGTHNLVKGLLYSPNLPLCLCMDFNVEPMIWEVAQIHKDKAYFIDEIRISPASIEDMVREFRNRYPMHPHELWIFGDSTGTHRIAQTAKSDYDLVRLHFRGYGPKIHYYVPPLNPLVKDRVNAFNLKLKGIGGEVGVFIDPDKCPELTKDLQEVMIKDGKIVKTNDRKKLYFFRTHASDGAGYFIFRQWPTIQKVYEGYNKSRPPRRYGRVLGQL